jgi:1-deoxy-D-xylulose-5-phosphate reductoisomerase
MGKPDMRIPIAAALEWPLRLSVPLPSLDLSVTDSLSFEKVDKMRFPCLDLAYQAIAMGSGAGVVLHAANEVAVTHFLERKIAFSDISALISSVLEKMGSPSVPDLLSVLEVDKQARSKANSLIKNG